MIRPTIAVAAAFFAAVLALPAGVQAQTPVDALIKAWAESPHAKIDAEAFTHWDEDGEVEAACANCHSGIGFNDFIGADGSAAGVIDHPVPIRSVIDCATCHNEAANMLASVTFPSGATIDGLDGSARCMVCHQGRESTVSVDKAVEGMGDDDPNPKLAFLNVHYRAAAASLYGTEVKGAYEYEGKSYMGKLNHPKGVDTCIGCHDPHSTEVKEESCAACHKDVAVSDIRFTPGDPDGDGDSKEGIAAEIAALHEKLMAEIQAYATKVTGTAIAYDSHAYPYFFADKDGDGAVGEGEGIFPNRYQAWTPRLLRAAYNYQFVAKDPGMYAHNPHYALQILYDSLESLAAETGTDVSMLSRP